MAGKSFKPNRHTCGGGHVSESYSERNTSNYFINDCIPTIVATVQSIDIKPGMVFTMVDYGAADGGVSMQLWYSCIKAVREKHGNELPITIIYEDQPVNDFKSVFMRTQGLIPSTFRSYLHDFPNVYVLASGTSFYQQCLPNNSVHLGFSSMAMQWLSKKPCDLQESINIQLSTDKEEIEQYRKQAAKDWEQMLLLRGKELVPDGRMVICCLCTDDKGQSSALSSQYTKVGIFDLLSSNWKAMRDEGIISKEEFVATIFNVCYRTKDDFMKPFERTDSPVVQTGLELVSIDIRLIPNSLKNSKQVVAAAKAWGIHTFLTGLSETRSTEKKEQIVDELYRRCEEEISKNPEDYGWDVIYAFIIIRKK